MPDLPDPAKNLLSRLLTIDRDERITLERLKRHPAVRDGIPRHYTCPCPLPIPAMGNLVDPESIDKNILQLLNQIGFKHEKELLDDLKSSEPNLAKTFCLMLENRLSIDNLPWPQPTANQDNMILNNRPQVSERSAQPLDFSFGDFYSLQNGSGYVEDSSGSFYSLAEHASWDPKTFNVEEGSKNMSCLSDIKLPLETVVAAIQRCVNEAGFDWFYPNDMLVISRKQPEKTDMVTVIEHLAESELKIKMHFLQGNITSFNTLVAMIAQSVKALLREI